MPPVRDLLLGNLARNQSFDAALKKGDYIDQIAGQYLNQVLYNQDAAGRGAAIKAMQAKIVSTFEKKVQPAARKLGVDNARAVLAASPPPPEGLNNSDYRKKVLYEGKMHSRDRVRIVQANVNDRANTLENRLTAFWLEPGLTPRQKLDTLRNLHEKMDKEQKAYNAKLSDHLAGKGARPRKPNVDFMARFQNDVKQDVRVQARRAGTDAETEHFEAEGHTLLSWVTVNASQACPDCRHRQGVTGTTEFWDQTGRPGSGSTICGASCFCMLVPSKTLDQNPDLKQKGLETNAEPVATPPEAAAAIQQQRDDQKSPEPFPAGYEEAVNLRQLGPLGGSTGAKLVEDANGQKFVFKTGTSPDHLREEFTAEQAYRAFGADVPDSRLFEQKGQPPIKLSKYIENGKTVGDLKGEERAQAIAKAQTHFAADAILGNWDAAGQGLDNLIVDPQGKVYRIDTGGALRYRAQGKPKGDAFGQHPLELLTLRDKKLNPDAAKVFGGMTHDQVMDSARTAVEKREVVLAAVPKELRDTLAGRFDNLGHVVKTNDTLKADAWKQDYRATFADSQMRLRAAGFTDALPAKLEQRGKSEKLIDENGVAWDQLRGPNGLSGKLLAQMDAMGGSAEFLDRWATQQASDSWRSMPSGVKYKLAAARSATLDGYYWRVSAEGSKADADGLDRLYGAAKVEKTLATLHAATFETLSNVDIPFSDREAGTISLLRTEDKKVIQGIYELQRGQKGVKMDRGAAESFSLVRPVQVKGTEVTVQTVPHHRVFSTYFLERKVGVNEMFYDDSENEFLVMSEGIPLDYNKDPRRP